MSGGDAPPAEILRGYAPGVLGRCVELHALTYARLSGFGRFFEGRVAAGLADFADRLDSPGNGFWCARRGGRVVGTIAIDGEDLGGGVAHLRWFVVEEGERGGGLGRRLLAEVLGFCDGRGFAATRLWTFRGLDAARRLYEEAGFRLIDERPGRQWGGDVMEQVFERPSR